MVAVKMGQTKSKKSKLSLRRGARTPIVFGNVCRLPVKLVLCVRTSASFLTTLIFLCKSVSCVYEASPGQSSVPESSRTASVKTISTHRVQAAHMTMPSPYFLGYVRLYLYSGVTHP